MRKEQLESIKGILSVLDLCVLKDATTIASCVSLTKKLQDFAKVVKELEDSLASPPPQVEQKVLDFPKPKDAPKVKRVRKPKEVKAEQVSE
jgi:hypothetical protein